MPDEQLPEPKRLGFAQICDGYWRATGCGDTSWEIVARGGRFGLIVAHWDRPDWWFDALDDAMAFAAMRNASPPIPEHECSVEIPLDD
jgi:hypothetical protein